MPSPLSIRELAETAKASGAVDLAQGVIQVAPPAILIDILKGLPISEISRYNNKRGVPEYRAAIAKYLARRGWDVPVENIAGTAGAMAGISSALLQHCSPGAKVLLPEPFFQGHAQLLKSLGLEAVHVQTPYGEPIDWKSLAAHFPNVEAAIITTPSNPTGQVASPEQLQFLLSAGQKHNCFLIIDEMYREFIWDEPKRDDSDHQSLDLSLAAITRSFSKTLSIPGWRAGWIITSPELMEAISTTHDPIFAGGSTIAQNALAQALDKHDDELTAYVDDLRELCRTNASTMLEAFAKIEMVGEMPAATYYLLLRHNRASDMEAFEELLKLGLVATPGSAFFSDQSVNTGFIRIHAGISTESRQRVVAAVHG